MKPFLSGSVLILALLPAPRSPQEPEHGRKHKPDTELSAYMEKIEDGAKLLRKQLRAGRAPP
jgi:hypothetical protein